jgi:hypothetical protein
MLLLDNFDGTTVHVRMDQVSSTSVTNQNISSLRIIEWGTKPVLPGVKPPDIAEVPKGFSLLQNYPNPFNPSTQIQFATDHYAEIFVAVYDVLGREVSELAKGSYSPGVHSLTWDGKNASGVQMPSGVYYVRMLGKGLSETDSNSKRFTSSRKMLMLK